MSKGVRIVEERAMRNAMRAVKSRFGDKEIIGAEIGVFRGQNAKDILSSLPNVKLLYLIDPYDAYEGWEDSFSSVIEGAKEEALRTLKPFKDRIVWIFKKTEDSIEDVKHPLHFIYIDGNHSYEYVKKDIEIADLWVMSGGVIGGHDFTPSRRGIVKAVFERCFPRTTFMVRRRDWWFIKK